MPKAFCSTTCLPGMSVGWLNSLGIFFFFFAVGSLSYRKFTLGECVNVSD